MKAEQVLFGGVYICAFCRNPISGPALPMPSPAMREIMREMAFSKYTVHLTCPTCERQTWRYVRWANVNG